MVALYATDKRGWNNQRLAAIKQEFSSWQPTLQEIGDYMAPYSHEFTSGDANNGRRRDSAIINNTPTDAVDVAVSGLFNGLCDPTEQWVALEAVNRDLNKIHAVRRYCEEVSEIVLSERARSNFYHIVPEDFESILAFGTCASICLEAYDRAAFWYTTMPMGTYYIANNARRIVDVVGREMQMTASQMADQFKEQNLSDAVREALRRPGGAEQRFTVAHLLSPNPEHIRGNALAKHKRYRSCYWEVQGGHGADPNRMLLEEGFDRFPAQIGRWKVKGNDAWGRGPGHYALGDSKAIQAMEYDLAYGVEVSVKPPTISGPGTNFTPQSVLPGANTQAQSPEAAESLKSLYGVNIDVEKLRTAIAAHEDRVRRKFWNHIFLMLANDDGGKMTAREVAERAQEKRVALTPILRITGEYLTPGIAYNIDVLGRRGMLPQMPEELRGQPLKLEYKSVLAEAAKLQRAAQVTGHMLGFVAPLAELHPESLDVIDFDEMGRGQALESGVPARYLRDPKKVEALRAQRAQDQAKMQQAERANMVANTVKTLSETQTGGRTALADLSAAAEE